MFGSIFLSSKYFLQKLRSVLLPYIVIYIYIIKILVTKNYFSFIQHKNLVFQPQLPVSPFFLDIKIFLVNWCALYLLLVSLNVSKVCFPMFAKTFSLNSLRNNLIRPRRFKFSRKPMVVSTQGSFGNNGLRHLLVSTR